MSYEESINDITMDLRHSFVSSDHACRDMSTMVELTSFSTLGKIQPFLVSISTSAAVVVDLHCHLTDKEVCGYLGGHWDINTHSKDNNIIHDFFGWKLQ